MTPGTEELPTEMGALIGLQNRPRLIDDDDGFVDVEVANGANLMLTQASPEDGSESLIVMSRRQASQLTQLLDANTGALVKALEPFAVALEEFGDEPEIGDSASIWESGVSMNITFGNLRKAASALRAHLQANPIPTSDSKEEGR